jgi:hypothetical protein
MIGNGMREGFDLSIFNWNAWTTAYEYITRQYVEENFADLFGSNTFAGFNYFQYGLTWVGGALRSDGSILLTDESSNSIIINKTTFDNIDASLNSINANIDTISNNNGGGGIDPSNNYFVNDGTGTVDCESVAANSINTLTLNCVSVAASETISCKNIQNTNNIASANMAASNSITTNNLTVSTKLTTPEISSTTIKDVFYLSATYLNSPTTIGVYGINGNTESGVRYYNPIPFFCSIRKIDSPFRNALNSAIIMPQFRATFYIFETDYVNDTNGLQIVNANTSPTPIFYAFSSSTVLNINNPNQTLNFLDNIVAVKIERNINGAWVEINISGLS